MSGETPPGNDNDIGLPGRLLSHLTHSQELGGSVGTDACISAERIRKDIQSSRDKDNKPVHSPKAGIAACKIAYRLLGTMKEKIAVSPEVEQTIDTIRLALLHGAVCLQEGYPEKKPTGPKVSPDLKRQACCVLAVGWLQELKRAPLDPKAALAAVADVIPKRMVGERTAERALLSWLDAFRRPQNIKNKKLLQALWLDVLTSWDSIQGKLKRDENGEVIWGEHRCLVYEDGCIRQDCTDACQADVLDWLREKLNATEQLSLWGGYLLDSSSPLLPLKGYTVTSR